MSKNNRISQGGKGWISWFAHNPVAANLLMVTLLIAGFATLGKIRTEGQPEPAPNTVSIQVNFEGGSPENVEEGAAIKIEEALNGMEGVYGIVSQITSDKAVISVKGKEGYPVGRLKDTVKTRVDAITSFPTQVDNIIITQDLEEQHILYVQIYGEASHSTLKQIARKVRKRLLALESVNKILVNGARDYEVNIEVQEEKLRAYGLSFDEVAAAVRKNSMNLGAGQLKSKAGSITIQSREQKYHGREFEGIVVRSSNQGGLVRIKDIARVRDGYTDQAILSSFQGKPSIGLDVRMMGRDSIVAASNDVRAFLGTLENENWIPDTIKFSVWSDEADIVRDSIGLLSKNALLGIALVLVLLSLFLHPKVAFWVAVGIPVSFAGVFILMGPTFLNYSMNNLTAFGFIIALGIVVDDAIVIGESIFAHKKKYGGGVETAVRGTLKVATPTIFGVLTTVAAFYPLTSISGFFGGPFRMIAVVTIVCLLFSLVESKLILPAHLSHLKIKEKAAKDQNLLARFFGGLRTAIGDGLQSVVNRMYIPLLKRVVRHRYQSLALFVSILILACGLVSSGTVKLVFFGEEEGSFLYA
ncbi:MAG: efflux RND transporter permease subunit, partial [Desulfobacterales bacterium]|nr:efflux RND transporter permease subunit [Desulfobacterales bacterium]